MFLERCVQIVPLRIRSVFRRKRAETELEEELRFHIEHLTEMNIERGMAPEEARFHALKAMEGVEQKKEECRDVRAVNWIESVVRDIGYGLRMLRRTPLFTAVAILSMALGIGANSAIFSAIDTLLLRPLPVPHPEELRNVFLQLPERPQAFLSYPIFRALQTHNRVFTAIATWSNHRFQMESGDTVVHLNGQLASGSFFDVLSVKPALGRTFNESDDHVSGGKDGPVAVISDGFWNRHYQRSPSAIGKLLVLDGAGFTVIGVMPPRFFGAEVGTHSDVWIPISLVDRVDSRGCISSASCWWLTVTGRMKPGVTANKVSAQLAAISGPVLKLTVPPGWKTALQKRYLAYTFSSESGAQGWSFLRLVFANPLVILMTLVSLVLLIVCANMANLLLARAFARQREIAVRLSMGAGRIRVIRQLLTESVLLALAGGVAGTAFAIWLTRILIAFVSATQRQGPGQFTSLELHPDWRIVLFTFGVTLLSGILFGLAPALRSTRLGIATALKQSVQSIHGHDGPFQSGRYLLTVQSALSIMLVAAAALFAGTLYRMLSLHYGFDPANVWLVGVDTDKLPDKGPALDATYARLLERLNALPGMKAVSLLQFVPLSSGGWDENLRVPGKASLPDNQSDTFINPIGPRYFEAMGTRLLSGRQFTAADSATSARVGIISELAAQRFFSGENPIGQSVVLEGKEITVVGVAETLKYLNLRNDDSPELYIPYTQRDGGMGSLTFVIRTVSGAPSPDAAVRGLIHRMAPHVPVSTSFTMAQQVESSVGKESLLATLSMFFGILALLLTSIGLYGVLAYTVTRRSSEIGIRMALGAGRGSVIWLVLRGAVAYVSAGIVLGALAVLASSRVVADLLYGMRPNDPATLMSAIGTLLLITAIAALVPSLRASRLDPAISLRQE